MTEPGPTNRRRRLLASLVVFGILGSYVASRFEVTSDVTQFLPDPESQALATVSRELVDSEFNRTLLLAVGAQDTASAIAASRSLEAELRDDPLLIDSLQFIEGGPREGLESSIYALYSERALGFLAPDPERARERLSERGLARAARELREALAGPLSSIIARSAPGDPLQSIPALFRRVGAARADGLGVSEGRFIAGDGRTAVLFLATRDSALDAEAQMPVLAAIDRAFERVRASSPGALTLDRSGVHPIATETARTIRADIQRVSILSSVLLSILLVALFRSLRFVALASIPVAFGMLAGASAVLAIHGRLHGISLAFGASLIGVSIDYVVHLYCHHTIVAPAGGPWASTRSILRPLATGAITTIAGFVALGASNLQGLREIALFSVVGLFAAFVASVGIVPEWMGQPSTGLVARPRFAARVTAALERLSARRALLGSLLGAALLFALSGMPSARFNPDLSSLSRIDPEIMAEGERARARLTQFESDRFVVSIGDEDASALEVNDRVYRALEAAIAAGELGSQRSLAPLLPSPDLQRRVAAVAHDDSELPERLGRVFTREGFAPGAFDDFLLRLSGAPAEPLAFAEIAASPAAPLVRSFHVDLDSRVGILTFLADVRHPEAIASRIEAIPNALFLSQSDLFSSAQEAYQRATAILLTAGLAAVFALLALRYRDVGRTLAAFLPSVLAAAVTVSALTFAGRGIDLISLTSLLFVVSIGVDYSVFLVDASDEPDPRAITAALTGAFIAGTTTVVAFGLLAASPHPVLSGLGLSAAVGVGSSLLLAPTTLLLVRPLGRSQPDPRHADETS